MSFMEMLLLDKILQLRIIWYAMAFPAIYLTHWGWVMHICVSKLTIIGSDNGLSPGWLQAIIWTNTAILLIGPLVNKLQWNLKAKLMHFHWRKMHFKKSSAKWRAFCFNPNVLKKTKKNMWPPLSKTRLADSASYWYWQDVFLRRESWENCLGWMDSRATGLRP